MVKKFILQWHLSEVCNLKCTHCYQENHKPVQLKFGQLVSIYEQYKELLQKLNVKGHINITGGEPLCNPYLFEILDLIKKDRKIITFSILTNGTLITNDIAKKIKKYSPYYVQVSLEGKKKTNDKIRGRGTYKKIAMGIKHLKNSKIFTSISFTATKLNYKEFPSVIKYAKKHKVDNVWSDRYIPIGASKKDNLYLNKEETQKYIDIMNKQRIKLLNNSKIRLRVSMARALQFQVSDQIAYGCTAGDTLLTVMENGDLVPCRRMPIVVGNLLKENMYTIYKNNNILKDLRKNYIPDDCKQCEYSETCHGGLKCLTYALYNDLNHKDIGCNL